MCPRCISYDASGAKCASVNIGFHSNVCVSDGAFSVNSFSDLFVVLVLPEIPDISEAEKYKV